MVGFEKIELKLADHVYLDNAASTKVDELVLEGMLPYFLKYIISALSSHNFGKQDVEAALRKC